MAINILFLLAGLALLYFAAEAMVKGASQIALDFGISPLIVGLTVVAFGTSAPEFVVSFLATYQGASGISVGNIVGSNICNLALILGVSAVIYPLAIDKGSLGREYPIMLVASLAFFAVSWDGQIARWEGGILFAGIVAFVTYNMLAARRLSQLARRAAAADKADLEDLLKDGGPSVELPDGDENATLLKNIAYLVVGIIGLTVGAQLMVVGARAIAESFGVPDLIIGITVVAFGTSLPELATCGVAAYRKEADISIGNVIGSNIFNILFIMGFVPAIFGMPVEARAIKYDFPIMLAITLLIFPLMRHNFRLGRAKGIFLLTIYVGYTLFLFVGPSV